MTTRFNLYFPVGSEYLLEEAKENIPNLSDFLLQAIRERLRSGSPQQSKEAVPAEVLFRKKFGDLESEAYLRQVFDDHLAAEQALKNRLTEMKRAHKEQFGDIVRLFAAKYPGYAKIVKEL